MFSYIMQFLGLGAANVAEASTYAIMIFCTFCAIFIGIISRGFSK